jgi:hypothetical protein
VPPEGDAVLGRPCIGESAGEAATCRGENFFRYPRKTVIVGSIALVAICTASLADSVNGAVTLNRQQIEVDALDKVLDGFLAVPPVALGTEAISAKYEAQKDTVYALALQGRIAGIRGRATASAGQRHLRT